MSYVVLARKYRPMFFKDVLGQQHVTTTLQNAIQMKRIANAYLFSGPRGVGKTTVARLLSKALNCENGPTIHPCNSCSCCIEINESRSLDVFEIDGASNRGIDEVRNLRESVRYSPHPGKFRIYIIDEVHMLTNEAFNALLKTLEEPPPSVLFIFATTEVHKVPATILSRCQRFDFKRITQKNLMEQLRELCKHENINIDDESMRIIALKADGSMRDAESILDQIIAYSGSSIQADAVASLLGVIDMHLFFQLTDFIKRGDVEGGIDLAHRIFYEGYDFSEFLSGLAEHFRNFLVVKATKSTVALDVSEEHSQKYVKEENSFQVEDLLRLIKIVSDTEAMIRRSSNPRMHLEVALVKMIKLNKSIQLSQLLEAAEDLKKKPESITRSRDSSSELKNTVSDSSVSPHLNSKIGSHHPPVMTAPAIPSSGETQSLEKSIELPELEQKWGEIIEHVKKKKIALGSFLSEGWPIRLEGKVLEIAFKSNNEFHMNSIERNSTVLESLIGELLHVKLRVRCVKDDKDILTKPKSHHSMDKNQEFSQLVEKNEIVKTIVTVFNTELIK
jgi:DNA polymerase III subunit gamma/tau